MAEAAEAELPAVPADTTTDSPDTAPSTTSPDDVVNLDVKPAPATAPTTTDDTQPTGTADQAAAAPQSAGDATVTEAAPAEPSWFESLLPADAEPFRMLTSTEGILRFVGLVVVELAALIGATVALWMIVSLLLRRIERVATVESIRDRVVAIRKTARFGVGMVTVLLCIAVLLYDAFLVYRGDDALSTTLNQIKNIPREAWITLGLGIGQILGVVILATIFNRIQRKVLKAIEDRINKWDQAASNDQSLKAFFTSLSNALANSAWLFVLWFAVTRLPLPDVLETLLLRGITIYLTIAIGLLVVRMTTVVVETVDALSSRFVEDKAWKEYYDHLRKLVPLLRRCIEWALWVGVASLVLAQLSIEAPVAQVDGAAPGSGAPGDTSIATYGMRVIQAIGIFFIGRVLIELGHLIIENTMTGNQNLDEAERRRRTTIEPLVKSIFQYSVMFVVFVLMLISIGFDPMPFLAGAGILGMVIGLGAQPLINDVMSGFFILFENTYLVGDFIDTGEIRGTVESIDFRTTRLRDVEGNLCVVRNGDLRRIINYSKDFTNAVVTVKVSYDTDVRKVFDELQVAGETVRKENEQVLSDIDIRGITEFDDDGMTIRTVTRVEPGCHSLVAASLRLAIKDRFDAAGIAIAGERLRVILDQSGEAPTKQPQAGDA